MAEVLSLLLLIFALFFLMSGFPVAFTLAGTSILFSFIGVLFGVFDLDFLGALPERIYGVMRNETLLAIPLFVLMGVMLEKSKISEELLTTMSSLFGRFRGGLGISVCIVGGLLAASTGIVGATVVTMGLISLPVMLKRNYNASLSSGIICASGTLGQIIPPSIVLVILGDVMSSANQQAQLSLGNFAPTTVSVGDLFAGALIPGVLLMTLYISFVFFISLFIPKLAPALTPEERNSIFDSNIWLQIIKVLTPPLLLIIGVLGSILTGLCTPTEAASIGAIGSILLSMIKKRFSLQTLKEVLRTTTEVNAMVFTILIGASIFSLVFRGFGGDESVQSLLMILGDNVTIAFIFVMLVMFLLGFFLDFFEIVFVVVPIVGPILIQMGLDPIWLGVAIALNLQTSFLTPPFGFSLFYLRGVAPSEVKTSQIYKGVIPFIGIQVLVLLLIWMFPEIVTWLPRYF